MLLSDFKDYLKSLFPEYKYYLGFENKEVEKAITLFNRNGTAGLFFYNSDGSDIQILPTTLLISYNGNYADTERNVYHIYNSLVYKNEVSFGDFVFSIFPKQNRLPVYLGKSEEGHYQFALDIDVIYNK